MFLLIICLTVLVAALLSLYYHPLSSIYRFILIFLIIYLRPLSFSGDYESYADQFSSGVTYSPELIWTYIVYFAHSINLDFLLFQSLTTSIFAVYLCNQLATFILALQRRRLLTIKPILLLIHAVVILNTIYLSLLSFRMFLAYSLLFSALSFLLDYEFRYKRIFATVALSLASTQVHLSAFSFLPYVILSVYLYMFTSKKLSTVGLSGIHNDMLFSSSSSISNHLIRFLRSLKFRKSLPIFSVLKLVGFSSLATLIVILFALSSDSIIFRLSDYTQGGSYQDYNTSSPFSIAINIVILLSVLLVSYSSPNIIGFYPWLPAALQLSLISPVIMLNLASPLVGRLTSYIPYILIYALLVNWRAGNYNLSTNLATFFNYMILFLILTKYIVSLSRLTFP